MSAMTENSASRWLTWQKVLLVSILLPPAGLVMSWLRPWRGGPMQRLAGLAGRLALSSVLVVLTLVYAVWLGLLHVEMSGVGWRPIFSMRDPASDRDALESHRLEQRSALPPPAAAGVSEAGAAAVSESDAAAVPEAAVEATGPAWTDFRGPRRDGHYTEGPIQTVFPSEGPRPLWRQPIGGGYASFVIANGSAYTIEQRRGQEVVAAYDVLTGRALWTHGWAALFSESMGGDGPRATPVWDNGRIYALGATGELAVLNADTGRPVWSKNILDDNDAKNITWGMSNSPLIVDDKVIVTPGGPGGKSIVAYDKRTGERVWGALSDSASYTSPMLVTLEGQRQILAITATRVVGLNVQDGALLWEFPWMTMYEINSAQPIVTDASHVFVSAGYDHGSALVEIARTGEDFSARGLWESRNMKNRFNSSVLYQGHIYGFDEGIFACIDLRSGARKWKGGRYGYGQALLAGEHIIVLTESGEVAIVLATPEAHREVAIFSAIDGKTWNNPAMAGGILLVRNTREMAAFRLAP